MKTRDSWETPDHIFEALNSEFQFDIDLCATDENKKCKKYCKDVFKFKPTSDIKCGFMNPPYSNQYPFLAKAYELSASMKVVCLIRSDLSAAAFSSTGIFQEISRGSYIERVPSAGISVRIIKGRIQFTPPEGVSASSNTSGSLLLIMDRTNEHKDS